MANVLERAQLLAEENLITLDDLPDALHLAPARAGAGTSGLDSLGLSAMEHRLVHQALQQAQGNKVHAAELLGISRRKIYRLIDKHRLPLSL